MPYITRFSKNEILHFAGQFYQIAETDRIRQKFDLGGQRFPVGANDYIIKEIVPTKGKLVHVDKIGINGYIEVQLKYPESIPRGAVKGAQRFNYEVGNHQNPFKYTFFVIETVEPFLNVLNPKSYTIKSQVWFYGWYYEIIDLELKQGERPRDPVTNLLLPFTDITNFVPYTRGRAR